MKLTPLTPLKDFLDYLRTLSPKQRIERYHQAKRDKNLLPILKEAPPDYVNDPKMKYGAEEWKEEIYLGY